MIRYDTLLFDKCSIIMIRYDPKIYDTDMLVQVETKTNNQQYGLKVEHRFRLKNI